MVMPVVPIQSMEVGVVPLQEIPIAIVPGQEMQEFGYGPSPGSSNTRSSKTP
jgi:hypothetical protein